MGTRGLLGHIIRSKNIRKGTYNHFDSYPEGLGAGIAKFIKSLTEEQIEKMIEMLGQIEWIEDKGLPAPEELQTRYAAFGFADTSVGNKNTADWYCLLRNVQGEAALPHILDGSLTHLVDATGFEHQRLGFPCEWTYWIDWEARTVQVLGGEGPMECSASFAELSDQWMSRVQQVCYGEEWEEEDEQDSHAPV